MDIISQKKDISFVIKIILQIVKAAGKLLLLIVVIFFLALKKAAESV